MRPGRVATRCYSCGVPTTRRGRGLAELRDVGPADVDPREHRAQGRSRGSSSSSPGVSPRPPTQACFRWAYRSAGSASSRPSVSMVLAKMSGPGDTGGARSWGRLTPHNFVDSARSRPAFMQVSTPLMRFWLAAIDCGSPRRSFGRSTQSCVSCPSRGSGGSIRGGEVLASSASPLSMWS
jgi:hypothetical protein